MPLKEKAFYSVIFCLMISLLHLSSINGFGDKIVLQGKEVTQDASMYSAPEARGKHYDGLTVSRGNVYYCGLIRFDVSKLPKKQIADAAIMLFHAHKYSDNPIRISAYVVKKQWDERYVSWNMRTKTKKWGKDAFGKQVIAEFDITKDYGKGWIVLRSKKLTELVNKWILNKQANYGLILRAGLKFRGFTMRFFASSEDKNIKRQPKLIVSYSGKIDPSRYGYISNDEMKRRKNKDKVERKLFFERAEADWRGKNILVWKIGPWDRLSKYQLPKSKQAENVELSYDMLGDEYGVVSFAVTNLKADSEKIKICIEGQPRIVEAVTVRASYWVKSKPLSDLRGENLPVWVDDALPLVGNGGMCVLKGAETRRVWLTIDSHKLKAGRYSLNVKVKSSDGRIIKIVPVRINVLAVRLERDPQLCVFTYAYLNRRSTHKYYKQAVRDLKSHYQNTYVVDYYPAPKVDDKGNVVDAGNFSGLDDWLAQIKDAKNVLFFWCWDCGSARPLFGGKVKWLSPQWRAILSRWITSWYRYLHNKGFGYDRVIMYPFDETYDNKILGRTEYQALGEIADELHKINSHIRVFADPVSFRLEDLKAYKELADKIDVWSVSVNLLEKGDCEGWPHPFSAKEKKEVLRFFKKLQQRGKSVWAYQCGGPMKGLDVNGYYRKFAWLCWYNGITGMGIWSYNDIRGKSGWDDFDAKSGPDFTMIYELRDAPDEIKKFHHNEVLIPSRRWEIWRIAIQDYYLLEQVKKCYPNDEKVLNKIVSNVLNKPMSCSRYELARSNLLKMLIGNGRLKNDTH